MRFPERDGALNSAAQLRFLHQCARSAPGVRVVYAGTRQIYGKPRYLPVDEDHPIDPVDINGIHKHCAIQYHLTFSRLGLLDAVVLNLTNTYGPRMALDEPCQGFLATYIRRLAFGRPLEVFGDGRQLREKLSVDDAVDDFLLAGAVSRPGSRVYNVAGAALELREVAEIASEQAGGPAPVMRPFPAEKKAIDIGSYYTDSRRIGGELGWRPATPFAEGIGRTLSYYEKELPHYLDAATRSVLRPAERNRRDPRGTPRGDEPPSSPTPSEGTCTGMRKPEPESLATKPWWNCRKDADFFARGYRS
jgi:nucleoside-diphosphate-sugar epimerase